MKDKSPKQYEPCSPEFEMGFSDGFGGCRQTCHCGRECFDRCNSYDWEEGELENLEKLSKTDPEHYIGLDYCCSLLTVDGKTFVLGCPCNGARPYEDWIQRHEVKLAKYLNRRSELLAQQAEALKVEGVLVGEQLPGGEESTVK